VTNIGVLAKSRRAVALWDLGRYGEAAALLDELAADKGSLAKIVRDSPNTDEVATIYITRIRCHEELGHWPKVHACVAAQSTRSARAPRRHSASMSRWRTCPRRRELSRSAATGRRPLPWTPRSLARDRALPGDGEHLRGVVGSVPGDQTSLQ
jgi:hypothetical protein